MPYIDRNQRPLLRELLREIRNNPAWRNEEEYALLMDMLISWINLKGKEDKTKVDGYVNYVCTHMIKYTHRTYHTLDEHKTKIWNPFNKGVALFVREVLGRVFTHGCPAYARYERLYGLLSLMEVEFERRGWSLGRKDIKTFFTAEKKYWLKEIAHYEDCKIQENGDVE